MSFRTIFVPVAVAFLLALLVFGAVYYSAYTQLLARQPHGTPPFSPGATSYPPDSAWMEALPAGVLTFFLTVPLIAFLRRLW